MFYGNMFDSGQLAPDQGDLMRAQANLAKLEADRLRDERLKGMDPGARFGQIDSRSEDFKRDIEKQRENIRLQMALNNMRQQRAAPYAKEIDQNQRARSLGYASAAAQENLNRDYELKKSVLGPGGLLSSLSAPPMQYQGRLSSSNNQPKPTRFLAADGQPVGGIFSGSAKKSPVAGLL